jgi:UDP-N-acetylglucosamine--N-acetylmuramyl-(pentapeptide) pyrophosphoryl-undecaprenol N-acetylglucosamine transferase
MGKLQKVLIMAGGTGGHVFPGLAVARLLRDNGVDVHWLGTEKGLESRLVPESGFPLHFVSIGGLRGKGLKTILLAPYRLVTAIYQSAKILRELKPDIVLGMGGFVSGPGGIASWFLGYPLVIHEQNAKAGLTNKWLSKFAAKVMEGFPQTFLQRNKIVTTGNPVREEIASLPAPDSRADAANRPLRLLVVGGSLGASIFNELLPRALARIPESLRPHVQHQTGERHLDVTNKAYAESGITADVTPFIADMRKAYEWADMVLCRAGALTIAELCAAGLASILVPYPFAVDDHQTANADYLVKNNAALSVQQSALTEEGLAAMLKDLFTAPQQRNAMANAAYQLRRVDATKKVFEICEEVCR